MIKLPHKHRKMYLTASTLVIILVVVVGAAKIFDVGPFHKTTAVVSATSFPTKGEPKGSGNTNASPGAKSDSSSSNSSNKPIASSTATLFTPTGDFISNHHPNLSGSPAPNSMSSVCDTTPGASCKITFTQGSTTKALASQTTDANGSTYWYWKLQDIGLGVGSWKVQAIANLNGQAKTASDAMDLVVAQ
jgi:hypothetical protein